MKNSMLLISITLITLGFASSRALASHATKKYTGLAGISTKTGEQAQCQIEVDILRTANRVRVLRHIGKCDQRVLAKKDFKLELTIAGANLLYNGQAVGTIAANQVQARAPISAQEDYDFNIVAMGESAVSYEETIWDKELIAPFVESSVQGDLIEKFHISLR